MGKVTKAGSLYIYIYRSTGQRTVMIIILLLVNDSVTQLQVYSGIGFVVNVLEGFSMGKLVIQNAFRLTYIYHAVIKTVLPEGFLST